MADGRLDRGKAPRQLRSPVAYLAFRDRPYAEPSMFRILTISFIVVPILEIWVLTQVAGGIGWLNAISLVILVSAVGAWMVKQQGLGIIRRVEQRLAEGTLPSKELVDGVLIAVAGALMLTPGFITDAVSLLLLFPPTRAIVRTWLMVRYSGRIQTTTIGGGATAAGGFGPGFNPGGGFRSGDVIDVGEATYDADDDEQPGLSSGG